MLADTVHRADADLNRQGFLHRSRRLGISKQPSVLCDREENDRQTRLGHKGVLLYGT